MNRRIALLRSRIARVTPRLLVIATSLTLGTAGVVAVAALGMRGHTTLHGLADARRLSAPTNNGPAQVVTTATPAPTALPSPSAATYPVPHGDPYCKPSDFALTATPDHASGSYALGDRVTIKLSVVYVGAAPCDFTGANDPVLTVTDQSGHTVYTSDCGGGMCMTYLAVDPLVAGMTAFKPPPYVWKQRDSSGHQVAAGTYIVSISTSAVGSSTPLTLQLS